MIAIPLHQARVAPVLDWCSTIVLIPKTAGKPWHEGERITVETNIFDLLRLLRSMDVSHVICGALTPAALRYGQHLGLEFICGVSGSIDEVVEAYRAGELDHTRFRLPGCRCANRLGPTTGFSSVHDSLQQGGTPMSVNRGDGGRKRYRQGHGRSHGRVGRTVGDAAGSENLEDICVCPQCGKESVHSRTVLCARLVCRECGVPLVRKSPIPGSFL